MKTETYCTPTSAAFAAASVRMTPWVSPIQGIDMPGSASLRSGLHATTSATSVATAAAAKGATRKNGAGGAAFEDPV